MGKTIGYFDYTVLKSLPDEVPINAAVHISLKRFTSAELQSGWPLISPQLMTDGEIDWHVQALKDDLDHVGRLAKAALKRANEQTLKQVRSRLETKSRSTD